MTSPETPPVIVAAARNNADWCAAVGDSHGLAHTFSEKAWRSSDRTPPYYPDAVTLQPDAAPADFLSEIDTASPGCSVKDSFAALDLVPYGFVELFTAQWIHRRPELAAPSKPNLRAERISTAAQLRIWQTAWHGGGNAPDVFRPELLDDPAVLVVGLHLGDDLRAGAVLNDSSGVVGISNVFTVDDSDADVAWSSAITAAADSFPGVPLIGYQHGDDLAHALAGGFTTLGPLRVWLRDS
ncbi:hypothetical protein [Paractinoplanes ferrugineus]|uniref:hypothetical protein n=1 Tax=Paractinoplanes ferrugineus TaxID=113564 RepID=UPI001943A7A0|nr:hypothetical protein [Actinoplanes ferrugineus]